MAGGQDSRAGSGLGLLILAACDTQRVKELVSADFADPASARWRNISSGTTMLGEEYVCGEVNAKNLYGAYTGFRGFAANLTTGEVTMAPDRSIEMDPTIVELKEVAYKLASSFCDD